ncbi:MAG: PEP-utilizing enzyme [Candidatus Micrarchaeota archaeon]|nr:PEP-utilizing enzyme [Candidatus Micrarchaeota archaeon]
MSIQWEEVARRGKNHALLLIDQVAEAYKRDLLGATLDSDFKVQHFRQLAQARWLSVQDMNGYVAAMKSGIENDAQMMLRVAAKRNLFVSKMRNLGSDVKVSDEPAKLLEFIELGVQLWTTAYHYIIFNKFYPDLLVARVAAKEPDLKKQNQYLATLFELPEPTDARLEKNSLLEIALLASENENWKTNQDVAAAVAEHLAAFSHLGMYYYWGTPYSEKDIYSRLEVLLSKNLGEEVKVKEAQEKVNEATLEVFDKLKFGDEEKLMVANLRAWGQTANYADETYSFAVHKLTPLIKATCKEWSISWNQFASMRVSEIANSFENGFDEKLSTELSARFVDHAFIFNNPRVTILAGREFEKYKAAELAVEESLHHITELNGQSVCPGKVTGKARIVLSLEDADTLQRGEILVAPSTFPAYVPAMERSAAIVTNEGGLLCHAAIVAREIKIPCVVGTKIGTKVFRNGDLIEVDAVNGTVRKL